MQIRKLLILILCLCLFSGCGAASEQSTAPAPTPVPVPTVSPEAENALQETPGATEPPVSTENAPCDDDPSNESLRLDDSALTMQANTLFIGDSITHHLYRKRLLPMGYVGGASFMACSNAGIPHFFANWARLKNADWNGHGCSYDKEFENLSYAAAIEQSAGRWERIFFMMGSNGSGTLTYESYKEVIDYIYANNPHAVIYLQTIPNCSTGTVRTEAVSDIVTATVTAYTAEGIDSVRLLDTNSIWTDECMAPDDVHLSDLGLQRWHEYICTVPQ